MRHYLDRAPAAGSPGVARAGPFQDLMLANDVVRYADVWAFHGYPHPAESDEPRFPGTADEQQALARRHGAQDTSLWMTEWQGIPAGAAERSPTGLDGAMVT